MSGCGSWGMGVSRSKDYEYVLRTSNVVVELQMDKLLPGEQVTGAAHSVVMLTPLSERDRGRMGSLFVTNYKLSFIPLETSQTDEYGQRNFLLGTYDVPLTGVGSVWLTNGGPTRRERLKPDSDVKWKVLGVQVVCKNMKVLTFSFVNSPIDNGRKVVMALMHHAFPKRHDLLFAYECKEPYYPTLPADMNMFQRPNDWKRELERCECPHWRITCINGTSDAFMLTAGETLIVPSSVLDYNLMESARHFRSGRVPVWVWGRPEGAALLRSGELLQTDQSATTESVLLEQVRRSHPKLRPPHVMYLCGAPLNTEAHRAAAAGRAQRRARQAARPVHAHHAGRVLALPPLAALSAAHAKLLGLCTPTTLAEFWVSAHSAAAAGRAQRRARQAARPVHAHHAGRVLALPPLAALSAAHAKLLGLCTPTTLAEFWVSAHSAAAAGRAQRRARQAARPVHAHHAGRVLALPPLAALSAAHAKLLGLCTPTTLAEFWVSAHSAAAAGRAQRRARQAARPVHAHHAGRVLGECPQRCRRWPRSAPRTPSCSACARSIHADTSLLGDVPTALTAAGRAQAAAHAKLLGLCTPTTLARVLGECPQRMPPLAAAQRRATPS
ncbi:hypothetical protein ACJJTC_016998 [Scirpophaga incertulas]